MNIIKINENLNEIIFETDLNDNIESNSPVDNEIDIVKELPEFPKLHLIDQRISFVSQNVRSSRSKT